MRTNLSIIIRSIICFRHAYSLWKIP